MGGEIIYSNTFCKCVHIRNMLMKNLIFVHIGNIIRYIQFFERVQQRKHCPFHSGVLFQNEQCGFYGFESKVFTFH